MPNFVDDPLFVTLVFASVLVGGMLLIPLLEEVVEVLYRRWRRRIARRGKGDRGEQGNGP